MDYQPTINAMDIIEQLENEIAKDEAEKSAPVKNPSDTPNAEADDTESEFAPWDE